jgi:hypothetical protein
MKRFLLALAAAAVTLVAPIASAANATLNVSWTLPTQGCIDPPTCTQNVPLTGAYALTAIKLYVSTSPIADTSTMTPSATFAAGATTATYNATVANGDTLYVRVKATNAFGDSGFSTEVAKVITVPARPGVPTSVTVTLTIT